MSLALLSCVWNLLNLPCHCEANTYHTDFEWVAEWIFGHWLWRVFLPWQTIQDSGDYSSPTSSPGWGKFSNSAQVWWWERCCLGLAKTWRWFMAGVVSSKDVCEIKSQLVFFEITEKDLIFIPFERERGKVEVCLVLSYFWQSFATGVRWLFETCFPTLLLSWYRAESWKENRMYSF